MKKNCLTFAIIGASFLTAVIVISVGLSILSNHTMANLQSLQAAYAPPVVMIDAPEMGSSAPVGSAVLVSVTYLNRLEARRIELWMDGSLVSQQAPEKGQAQPPLRITFDLVIPSEGIHTILVRAINTGGVIGNSVPFQIVGLANQAAPQRIINVNQEQTIQDLADTYHMHEEDIQQANPNLPTSLPPGSTLIVPIPPGGPAAGDAGNQGASTPTATKKPSATPTKKPPTLAPTLAPLEPMEFQPLAFHIFPVNEKIPPAAPTDLQAKVENCTITLNWMDNADNEKYYTVSYINPSAQTIHLAVLQSSHSKGRAWYAFAAPDYGPLSFWVEANNDIGGAQSNIVPVDANPTCNPYNQLLEIEAVRYVLKDPGIDKYYCYVDFGNFWPVRVPAEDFAFIYTKDGETGIAMYLAGNNKLTIPLPKGSLNIEVHCMGWYKPGYGNGGFSNLGSGSRSFSADTWNGSDQILQIQGGSFSASISEITLNLRPFKPYGSPASAYGFDNPLLQAPYGLTQKRMGEPSAFNDPYAEYEYYWQRLIQWKWDGDKSKINGFRFYLNGKPVEDFPHPTGVDHMVTLPDTCGMHLRWQVAAYGPNYQSPLSPPVEEDLPGCEKTIIADISIPYIILGDTRDSASKFEQGTFCDTIDTYLKLFVDGQVRQFLGGGFYMALSCNQRYDLNIFSNDWLQQKYASVGGPTHFKASFHVPMQKNNTYDNSVKFVVGGELWGRESSGDSSLVTIFKESFNVASYAELYQKYPGNKCQQTAFAGYALSSDTAWIWCVQFHDADEP